jgi:hypothetical protein
VKQGQLALRGHKVYRDLLDLLVLTVHQELTELMVTPPTR